MSVPVIYEMDAIGDAAALEAVAVHWFCCEKCREFALAKRLIDGPISLGLNNDYIPGSVCEFCGTVLP